MKPANYAEWCKRHSCTHAHCPFDCEHPQPGIYDGELLCRRCLIVEGRRTVMIPCTPAVCD